MTKPLLALHRLPKPLTEPPEKPGQTLFESVPDAPSPFLTGAQHSATVDASITKKPSSKTTKKKTRMTAADIEAMAAEADTDSRPPSRAAVDLPPPPKVTSPQPDDKEPSSLLPEVTSLQPEKEQPTMST